MTTMIAFHGKPSIKAEYLKRVTAHEKADEIVQGVYWEKGKGCAVGCTLHSSQHSAYETELGIPSILARLEDRIFEGLSNAEAKTFPRKFLKAIRPGADLSKVFKHFLLWLLVDEKDGVIRHAKKEDIKKAIQDVAGLIQKDINGGKVTWDEWMTARRAANADADAAAANAANAAAYAADAAAYAAAADAYTDAAAYAAAADAYANAANAARLVARQESFLKQSKKLIQLMSEC